MTAAGYQPLVRQLHWAVAGMIVLQFVLAKLADRAGETSELRELALLANHRSVGMTILALAILRIVLRLRVSAPPPHMMPDWQQKASEISHWLLYALLFLLPITGWVMSSASASSISWFNLVPIPDLVLPDARLANVVEEVHETFAKVLLLLASVHVLAALNHQFRKKDNAIGRISSASSLVLFVAVTALGVYALT